MFDMEQNNIGNFKFKPCSIQFLKYLVHILIRNNIFFRATLYYDKDAKFRPSLKGPVTKAVKILFVDIVVNFKMKKVQMVVGSLFEV